MGGLSFATLLAFHRHEQLDELFAQRGLQQSATFQRVQGMLEALRKVLCSPAIP
jgi:hypothetical protein